MEDSSTSHWKGSCLNVELVSIAKIETCFDEKFGIPKQSGLISVIKGCLRFAKGEEDRQALHGLEQCSHIWFVTWFHQINREHIKPRVRPPRLGGEKSIGVHATRSPFRPNPIGLSLVELDKIIETNHQIEIWVKGPDLVNGTPVLDLKPYLPYCESKPDARVGWMQPEWSKLSVFWSEIALAQLEDTNLGSEFKETVDAVLTQDPRPAYQRDKDVSQVYGIQISSKNLRFLVKNRQVEVLEITEKEGVDSFS